MTKSYIDAEELIAEIESRMEDCKLPNGKFPTTTNAVRYEELSCLRNIITSLQQEQPVTKEQSSLEYWLAFFGCPEENIEKCATQIAQGYGAIRYLKASRTERKQSMNLHSRSSRRWIWRRKWKSILARIGKMVHQ